MLARAARSSALRAVRAPAVRRGMCTAAEEAVEELAPMSIKKPEVQGFVICTVATYIGALRWQSCDRALAKEMAAKAAAHAEAHPEPVAEVSAPRTLRLPQPLGRSPPSPPYLPDAS